MKRILMMAGALALSAAVAQAADVKPPKGFKAVSSLVKLPDFLPGMGSLYVNPDTLPAGPFIAYNKDGKLVSTIYMIPLKMMNDHENFGPLPVVDKTVVSTELYYNPGHPGVEEPHYHIVLWHVPKDEAKVGK